MNDQTTFVVIAIETIKAGHNSKPFDSERVTNK